MVFFVSPRTPFLHPCGCLTHQNRHTHPQRHSNILIFVWALNSDLSGSPRERLKHSKKNRTMALKHPAETPTKNLPRDTPPNPQKRPLDRPPRDPGRAHPEPGMGPSRTRPRALDGPSRALKPYKKRGLGLTPGLWMAHPEPGVGVGMALSRVQGGPVPGRGVVGPGVDFGGFGGCLWEVFCGRFGRVF